MDLWGIFLFFLLAFIIMSCCGYCCSRKQRGAVLSAPVVVTTTTHTGPIPAIPANTAAAYHTQTYSTPYPRQAVPTQMPMPMPYPAAQPPAPGFHPNAAPASMNPPPYDIAVSGAGAGRPNNSSYEKQLPYNPNYQL